MPDPSPPNPSVEVRLNFASGTLYATPNAGNVRLVCGSTLTFVADFPFSVEFSTVTGSSPPPGSQNSCDTSGQSTVTVTVPDTSGLPSATAAPTFKYTIKGSGKAAGKVLDPIIIVDKKPH
jgi:hypothetical protein